MSALPFKATHQNWDDEEGEIFEALFKFRIARARNCRYITGTAEDQAPFFTLYIDDTGDVIMHVCRGPNGQGYLVMGPTRKTCYVKNSEELYNCFGIFKAGHMPNRYTQRK